MMLLGGTINQLLPYQRSADSDASLKTYEQQVLCCPLHHYAGILLSEMDNRLFSEHREVEHSVASNLTTAALRRAMSTNYAFLKGVEAL